MKNIIISLLFGILLINASVLYAQKDPVYNPDTYKADSTYYANQAASFKKQSEDAEKKLKNLEKQKLTAKIKADLKTMSGEEFSKKYGWKHQPYGIVIYSTNENLTLHSLKEGVSPYPSHFATVIGILKAIVAEELPKAKSYKEYFDKYYGNMLMEQAIMSYYFDKNNLRDLLYQYQGNLYDHYLSDGGDTENEEAELVVNRAEFYNSVSSFAAKRMNWLHQNSYIAIDLFVEANKSKYSNTAIRKNIAYLQDGVIKYIIKELKNKKDDCYWTKYVEKSIPLFNFDNLGKEHMQREDLINAFNMKDPYVIKCLNENSNFKKALIEKYINSK